MWGAKGGQSTAVGVYSSFVKNSKCVVKQGAEVNRKGVRGGRLLKWGEQIRSKEGYLCMSEVRAFKGLSSSSRHRNLL